MSLDTYIKYICARTYGPPHSDLVLVRDDRRTRDVPAAGPLRARRAPGATPTVKAQGTVYCCLYALKSNE